MNKSIELNDLQAFEEAYKADKANLIATNAVTKNGVFNAAYDTSKLKDLTPTFSVEVKDTGTITNQKQSGRCWMFAGLNVIRKIAMKKLHIKDLELSESYLMFYDKLEKCNSQLEAILAHLDEEDNSRLLDSILTLGGQQDGGFWHFFVELVKKYGVCPKSAMPETNPSSASSQMDSVINHLVTKDSAILRNKYKEGAKEDELRALKGKMLEEIYRLLAICLSVPVKKFTFEYEKQPSGKKKDKKPEFCRITTTPKKFYEKYIKEDLDQYVVLVNWPMKNYKMYQSYTVNLCENVYGTDTSKAVNIPLDVIKKAIIASLKDNNLVWFACDVLASSVRQEGFLSTELLNLDQLFSVNLNFDKGDRLMLRASQCNHAMTFTGVNLDKNDLPNKWKVENSWGDTVGFKGNFVMSDKWFDEFVYEAVINKKYLTQEVLDALNTKPVVLQLWSPVNNF